jgi:formylglycine-generating enzyme required for sulfatase activity
MQTLVAHPAGFVHDMDAGSLVAAQQVAAQRVGLQPHFTDVFQLDGTPGPELAVIPSGWFEMGSPHDEPGHDASEAPQHYVQLTRAFAIARHTITADEWARFAAVTGWHQVRELIQASGREPVVNIRMADVLQFIQWLNAETGQLYRLPTEAEWEYAARAGTHTPFHYGDYASCREVLFKPMFPYPEKVKKRRSFFPECGSMMWASEVGTKPANLWGLHDMHGNVWEMTASPWHPDHQQSPREGHQLPPRTGKVERMVVKGGSWFDPASAARSAARRSRLRDELDVNLGFRVVREI